MLVVRDPDRDAILDLPLENDKNHYADGFENRARRRNWKFSPVCEEIIALLLRDERPRMSEQLSRARMIAGAAATLSALPRVAAGQTLEPIRIAGVLTEDFCAVTYAIARPTGSTAKAGLDDARSVSTSRAGTAATNAVVSGAYELGKGSPVASILAHLRGLPLVIVANQAIWSPRVAFNRMVVKFPARRLQPIKTGADLNGKIAGAPGLNDLNQLGISVWMDKNGGDSKTLKWVELPNSVATPAACRPPRRRCVFDRARS